MDATAPSRLLVVLAVALVVGASLAGVAGVVGVTSAAPETRYVDSTFFDGYCGPSGSERYVSLQEAVDDSSEGDIVVVCRGFYPESVTVDKRLIIEERTTNGRRAVLDGRDGTETAITVGPSASGTSIDGLRIGAYASGVSVENASNVTISNTTFERLSGPAVDVTGASDVSVSGVDVTNSESGVSVSDASGVTVTNASFERLSGPAVRLGDANGVTVTGLAVTGGPTGLLAGNASAVTVTDATFDRLSGTAIGLNDSVDVAVRDTDVTDSGAGVTADASGGVTVGNTTFDGLSGTAVGFTDVDASSLRGSRLVDGSGGVVVRSSSGVAVVDTAFDGSSGPAVDLLDVNGTAVRNVTVREGSGGLAARSGTNVTVRASTFDGSPGPAVDVEGTTGALVRGVEVRNAPAGVVLDATPDARIEDVRAVEVDGPAVDAVNATGATVRNLDVSAGGGGVALTNSDGALVRGLVVTDAPTGVVVSATDTRRVADVRVRNATVTGGDEGVRARASAGGTLSGLVLSDLHVTGTDRGVGLVASGDGSIITGTVVENSTVEGSREYGVGVSAVDGAEIRNATLSDLSVDGPGDGEGVSLSSRGGELRNVSLDDAAVASHAVGVAVSGDDALVAGVTVFRSSIEKNERGIRVEERGSGPGVRDVAVRQSLVANSTAEGVLVAGGTDASAVRVTRTVVRDNERGVVNEGRGVLAAWLNDWGAPTGPGGGAIDPVTDAPADGDGDEVVGDVRFDPWLGRAACAGEEFGNVTGGTAALDYLGEVDRSALYPLCAWDRAPLVLRSDPADAATNATNLNLSYELAGVEGVVPADRRSVSIYRAGETFDLRFGAGPTNGSRFDGDEVQLVVLRDPDSTSPSFDVGFDDRTGETVLRSDAENATVREDWGAWDGTGRLTGSFEPPTPGSYTFVLVRSDVGPGLRNGSGVSELRVDGGATVLGFETVVVQGADAEATATGTNASDDGYPAGSDVPFDLASNLGDAPTDHAVLLYDASRFRNATMTVRVDATAAEVVAGEYDPATDVTVESSVSDLGGFYRASGAFSALGVDVAARSDSGRVDPSPLLGLGTRLYDTAAADRTDGTEAAPLDGSVVVVASDGPAAAVDVETFRNVSTGRYRYVYAARQGRETSSDTGVVEITTPPETPTPTAKPNDGGGGGGGGGGASGVDDGEVVVESAELLNGTVATGERAVVRVDLHNPDPAGGFVTLVLGTDGTTLVEETVRVPASSRRTVYVRAALDEPGAYDLALGNRSLGTLTVTGVETPTRAPGPGSTAGADAGPSTAPAGAGATDVGTEQSSGTPGPGASSPPGTDVVVALGMALLLLYGVGVAVYVLGDHPPSRFG